MTYKLKFLHSAQKEWNKLGHNIREQFSKKLKQRLSNPIVPNDQLRGLENHFKIKLRSSGYRLVYKVREEQITICIVAIGKRDKSLVYKKAKSRKADER